MEDRLAPSVEPPHAGWRRIVRRADARPCTRRERTRRRGGGSRSGGCEDHARIDGATRRHEALADELPAEGSGGEPALAEVLAPRKMSSCALPSPARADVDAPSFARGATSMVSRSRMASRVLRLISGGTSGGSSRPGRPMSPARARRRLSSPPRTARPPRRDTRVGPWRRKSKTGRLPFNSSLFTPVKSRSIPETEGEILEIYLWISRFPMKPFFQTRPLTTSRGCVTRCRTPGSARRQRDGGAQGERPRRSEVAPSWRLRCVCRARPANTRVPPQDVVARRRLKRR